MPEDYKQELAELAEIQRELAARTEELKGHAKEIVSATIDF